MKKVIFKLKKAVAICLSFSVFFTTLSQHVHAAENGSVITEVANVEETVSTYTEYEGENYHVLMSIEAEWDKYYNASITLTNTGDKAIENWSLSFKSEDEIENVWDATIYQHENNSYVIKNNGYNQDIAVGESVTFGYTASFEEIYCMPGAFAMIGATKEAREEAYSVVYNVASDWGSGYSANITITNLSDEVLEDWGLSFSFDREITTIWNATIETHEENSYVLKNAGYNQNIGVNESVVIGFNGSDTKAGKEPYDFLLTESAMEDEEYIELVDGEIAADYLMRAIYPTLLLQNKSIEDVRLSDDYDADGLSLIEEYQYDTNPFLADSDEDGLSDYDEISQHGTNPIKKDTDDDGLSDGTEISSGQSPLRKDTDDDGIVDGEEIIRQRVRLDGLEKNVLSQVGTLPSVEITGQGDYSQRLDAVKIERDATILDINCLVGTPFEFVHDEELTFESSRLTFAISDEILQKNTLEDLAIAWYNQEENVLEILETTCNAADNTISANVAHYSAYMVVNVPQYFFDIDWENGGSIIEYGKADVVFVVDTTGSMSGEIQNVRDNIKQFVAELEENNVDIRLGLVEYKDIYADGIDTTKSYGWYTDVTSFKSQLAALSVGGGGGDGPESIVDALECARGMSYRIGVKKYIIVLTDDNYNNGTAADSSVTLAEQIENLVEEKIVTSVVTIPLRYSTYKNLVTETDGISANINSNFARALEPLIEKMGEQVNQGCWVRFSDGSVACLDADPALGDEEIDTDEDGMPDIFELSYSYKVKARNPYTGELQEIDTWSYYSNPVKQDTDNDGLSDIDDLRPQIFDTTIIEENDTYIKFNTGRTWKKISCTSYDYLDNLMQVVDVQVDNPIPLEEFRVIIQNVESNSAQDFSIDELTMIGLLDNEGSKLYMHNESESTRETVFQNLTGRESKYYRHNGILWNETWSEVPKGTESGYFTGAVLSEADINFSWEMYRVVDVYTSLSALAQMGAVVITIIVVAYATPVVLANLEALVFYVKNFGVVLGLQMYQNLGVSGLPNGVISWLQMDMADGDSVLDDVLGVGNTLTDAQKSRLKALDNTIKNNLKESDFSGTLRDLQGNPVPNPYGGYYDHLTEMKQSYVSLLKIKKGLEGSLMNPNLSSIDRTLLQKGLDEANVYIQRIKELFAPFGGI